MRNKEEARRQVNNYCSVADGVRVYKNNENCLFDELFKDPGSEDVICIPAYFNIKKVRLKAKYLVFTVEGGFTYKLYRYGTIRNTWHRHNGYNTRATVHPNSHQYYASLRNKDKL
jgi:hypothetical protein